MLLSRCLDQSTCLWPKIDGNTSTSLQIKKWIFFLAIFRLCFQKRIHFDKNYMNKIYMNFPLNIEIFSRQYFLNRKTEFFIGRHKLNIRM